METLVEVCDCDMNLKKMKQEFNEKYPYPIEIESTPENEKIMEKLECCRRMKKEKAHYQRLLREYDRLKEIVASSELILRNALASLEEVKTEIKADIQHDRSYVERPTCEAEEYEMNLINELVNMPGCVIKRMPDEYVVPDESVVPDCIVTQNVVSSINKKKIVRRAMINT